MAELNEKKNERLRAAFGISDSYVDGSSFDPQRRAREAKQPVPEPPKPYRYTRPRSQCQVSVSLPNSKHSAPFFVCGLCLFKFLRFCFSEVEMSKKVCLTTHLCRFSSFLSLVRESSSSRSPTPKQKKKKKKKDRGR